MSVVFEILIPMPNVDVFVRHVATAWTRPVLEIAAEKTGYDLDDWFDDTDRHAQVDAPQNAPLCPLSWATLHDGRGVDVIDGKGDDDPAALAARVDAFRQILPKDFTGDLDEMDGHILVDALQDSRSMTAAWALVLTVVAKTHGVAVSSFGDSIWADGESKTVLVLRAEEAERPPVRDG